MMNLLKYKSVGESGGGVLMIRNGLSALLKSPPKGLAVLSLQASKHLLMVEESRLVFSAGFSTSAASETIWSFLNTFRVAALDHCSGKSTPEHHVSFNQFPGLMVPGSTDENIIDENITDENSETRRFLLFNLISGSFERDFDCNPLPVPHGYACHGSAYGWVFLVGDELDTKLMNPFTGGRNSTSFSQNPPTSI